jgi:hypothetical protein
MPLEPLAPSVDSFLIPGVEHSRKFGPRRDLSLMILRKLKRVESLIFMSEDPVQELIKDRVEVWIRGVSLSTFGITPRRLNIRTHARLQLSFQAILTSPPISAMRK